MFYHLSFRNNRCYIQDRSKTENCLVFKNVWTLFFLHNFTFLKTGEASPMGAVVLITEKIEILLFVSSFKKRTPLCHILSFFLLTSLSFVIN